MTLAGDAARRAEHRREPIVARYTGDRPWSYATGKAIFSTPVVGGDGTVYVGSADGYLYAMSRSGTPIWHYRTGNLIDSAAVLGRATGTTHSPTVTFGSGDEYLYQLRTEPTSLSAAQRLVWRYKAPRLAHRWSEVGVVGGQRRTRPRRRPAGREHRRRGIRSQP